MSRTAVVILNWNGKDYLEKFIPSVLECMPEGDELYVADNGSDDGSLELLRSMWPDQVRLILLDRNYGFTGGYNRALRHLDTERPGEFDYYLLLNSDIEVTPGWLSELESFMDDRPRCAVCAPKILSFCCRNRFEHAGASGGFVDRWYYPYCRGRILNRIEEDRGQYDMPCRVFWASGAACMVRTDVWRQLGGLDESFFAHMEEIDLCWRLRSRGHNVVCLPSSSVYHVGGATLKKDNPHKTFLNFRNNLLMLYKNLPEKELRRVMCVRACLDYVAAAFFFLKADFHNAHAVIEARKEYLRLRPQFVDDRRKNLASTQLTDIPERFRFSILWQAKVRGRKVFTALFR